MTDAPHYEAAHMATSYKLAVMDGLLHCLDDLVANHYVAAGPENSALCALSITLRDLHGTLAELHSDEYRAARSKEPAAA